MSDEDEKTFEDEHVTVWENKKDKNRKEKVARIRDSIKEARATNPEEAKYIKLNEESKEAEGKELNANLEKAHVSTSPDAPTDELHGVSPVTGPKELKPLKPVGREKETEKEADERKKATYNQKPEAPPEKVEVDPVVASLHQYANDPATFEANVNQLRQQIIGAKK